MEDREGCSMSIADFAFIIMVIAKAFFSANIEWWVVFTPLVAGLIYDIVELILKMRNNVKNK